MDTLFGLLAHQARRRGAEFFLFHPESGAEYRYSDSLALAERLACGLERKGVGRGDNVAILLPDGPAAVHFFLASAALGAPAVMLDVHLKDEEYSRIFGQCRPRLIVADAALEGRLGADCLWVDARDAFASIGGAGTFRRGGVRPEDPLAIFYTSGSTGTPKGVVQTHESTLAAVEGVHEYFHGDEIRREWSMYPIRTQPGVCYAALALRRGAALVLGSPSVLETSAAAALEKFEVEALDIVPSIVPALLRQFSAPSARASKLRWIQWIGGHMAEALAAELERVSGVPVVNVYGSTEASGVSATPIALGARPAGSVGRPFPGVEVRILDEDGAPLGPGRLGEVAVRSRSVMAGYFEQPGLTAQVLREGWCRPGDLGRFDEDGNLFLEGRLGESVLGAHGRAFGADVDAALSGHPGVLESATLARPGGAAGEELVAFVVRKGGSAAGEEELLAHCRSRLADYKCPARIRFLDAIPRSALGKVVKERLPG